MKNLIYLAILATFTTQLLAQPTDCVSNRYKQQIFNNIQVTNNITFGSAQNVTGFNQSLELDFYEPAPSEEYLQKRPLVVMLFGGAYVIGDKNMSDMEAWCDSLAHRGYACASVEYRLDNVVNFALPNQGVRAAYRAIQDARAAIRFLLEDPNGQGFNIDPNYIYTGGNSAGSITAIHTAYLEEAERPAETFNLNFFNPDLGCLDCSGNAYVQPFNVRGIIDLWGATLDLDFIDAAENVPMVIIHGDADAVVPYNSGAAFNVPLFPTLYGAVPMDAELGAKNICHEFYPYPGEGHVVYGTPITFPNAYWDPIFTQGSDFLYNKTMVYDSPIPTGALTACVGDIETYSVPANPNSIFCWDIANGTILSSNNEQVTVQWNTAGTGQLMLTEANCVDIIGTQQMINVAVDASCCAAVDLAINFDGFPFQTSWEILDAGGVPVATSSSYSGMTANSSMTENTCLADGCYTLNFNDAIGNGMCPFKATAASSGLFITPGTFVSSGTLVATLGSVVSPGLCGNYTLSDAAGATLATGGGSFGAQQSSTFCLSGGVAQLQQDDDFFVQKTSPQTTNIRIYPNPIQERLNIDYQFDNSSDMTLYISDVSGKIIHQSTYANNSSTLQIAVNDWAAGMYFVRLVSGNEVLTERFVK